MSRRSESPVYRFRPRFSDPVSVERRKSWRPRDVPDLCVDVSGRGHLKVFCQLGAFAGKLDSRLHLGEVRDQLILFRCRLRLVLILGRCLL